MSLSIADAKVDTFILLTKHSSNFFTRFFNNKSQNADLQTKLRNEGSEESMDFVRYMLQNMKSLKNRVTPPKVIHDKKSYILSSSYP